MPDIEFQDIRYGKKSQQRIELMKQFLFHSDYDTCSEQIRIVGKDSYKFQADLMTLNLKERVEKSTTTYQHPSLHIFAETNKNLNGRVLLIPAHLDIDDRKKWQENNLQKFSTNNKFKIIANDKDEAKKCFTNELLDAIDEFLYELRSSIKTGADLQCGFYKNNFLMIVMLKDYKKSNIFDFDYTKRKFLAPENLKHIFEQVEQIKSIAKIVQNNK